MNNGSLWIIAAHTDSVMARIKSIIFLYLWCSLDVFQWYVHAHRGTWWPTSKLHLCASAKAKGCFEWCALHAQIINGSGISIRNNCTHLKRWIDTERWVVGLYELLLLITYMAWFFNSFVKIIWKSDLPYIYSRFSDIIPLQQRKLRNYTLKVLLISVSHIVYIITEWKMLPGQHCIHFVENSWCSPEAVMMDLCGQRIRSSGCEGVMSSQYIVREEVSNLEGGKLV